MRTSLRSAAVVAATLGLVAGFTQGTADAATGKELNLCWTSRPALPNLDLDLVATGKSYRERTFDSGECKAWSVTPGTYKIVIDNRETVARALLANADTLCPGPTDFPVLAAKVRRYNNTYRTVLLPQLLGGDADFMTVEVRKNRRTSVSFTIACYSYSD